jgi:hypothetical protein
MSARAAVPADTRDIPVPASLRYDLRRSGEQRGHGLIWIVDKKVVPHLIQRDGQLAEVPVRVKFEYAVEDGAVIDGSLSHEQLYNKGAVCRHFPELDDGELDDAVQATVERAIDEHLALAGFTRP